MILINVLPPELRKRDTGVSPVFLAVLSGALVNAALLLFALWIHWDRIPGAEEQLADKEQLRTQLEMEVQRVEADRRRITQAEQRRDSLFALLGRKVFHARTLHEFVSLVGSEVYSLAGEFWPSVNQLSISPVQERQRPRGPAAAKQQVELQKVEWAVDMKIVGNQRSLAGDYVNSFFQGVANSPFWSTNGFARDPAFTYPGDAPAYNEDIDKVVLAFPLTWTRVVNPVRFETVSRRPVQVPGVQEGE